MRYVFVPRSLTQLQKLPKDIQRRIIGKLDFFCAQDDPLEFAESLTHRDIGEYRFRVGDYRIVVDAEQDTLIVLLVGNRKEIYR